MVKSLNQNISESESIRRKLEKTVEEICAFSGYRRAEAIKELGQQDLHIQDIPLKVHGLLEKALSDPMPEVRKEAVMTLTFLEGSVAAPLIEPLLQDSDITVRSNVIAAYSFMENFVPTEILVKKLQGFLTDDDPEIRDRAARAMGRLNILHVKHDLLQLAKNDPSPIVRAGAVAALGMYEEKCSSDDSLLHGIQKLLSSAFH